MGLKEAWDRIKGIRPMEREDLPDDVTTDKYLRSLRREHRVQLEETEKEQLQRKIADFNRERLQKHMFGIKEQLQHKKLVALKKKQESILSNGHDLLKEKTPKKKASGFLGSYNL